MRRRAWRRGGSLVGEPGIAWASTGRRGRPAPAPARLQGAAGLAEGALAGGAPGHRVGQHVPARLPEPVHRASAHKEGLGGVEAARGPDHYLPDAREPEALDETL